MPGTPPTVKQMELSIVTTLYKSSSYLEEFHRRAGAVARRIAGDSYEIIFVNDGSPDNSLELAIAVAAKDQHVSVIDLSRNFGHHKAMMTGLAHASSKQVFLLDSDLEEEPEWLEDFHAHRQAENADVVFGVQEKRKGNLAERFSGYIYYRTFRALTGINQPDNIVTARLMTKQYVEALLEHKERELNIGGLWIITGFKQSSCIVHKKSTSPTTYSIPKKLGHLVNAITSFSNLPLQGVFYFGMGISILSALYVSLLVFRYMFLSTPPDGYTSLIASIWLLSGAILVAIGIQGIYLSKVFTEVKQRPYTIVRALHGKLACTGRASPQSPTGSTGMEAKP